MKDIIVSIDQALAEAEQIRGEDTKRLVKVGIYVAFAICKAIYWGLGRN